MNLKFFRQWNWWIFSLFAHLQFHSPIATLNFRRHVDVAFLVFYLTLYEENEFHRENISIFPYEICFLSESLSFNSLNCCALSGLEKKLTRLNILFCIIGIGIRLKNGQLGNLARHSWGTAEAQLGHKTVNSRAQLGHSRGTAGAQLGHKVTWGTVWAQLRQTWGKLGAQLGHNLRTEEWKVS